MRLPVAAAIAVTGATAIEAGDPPQYVGVSTDTRTLQPGEAFVALTGERFDGHDHLSEAVDRGASMLFVARRGASVPGVTTVLVADTKVAYMALAGLARRQFNGVVLAITGSAGKTSTKAFAAHLLSGKYGAHVLTSPANENNEIGVSKVLLGADNARHRAIVVEMGARHDGDISALVAIARPDCGVLTNIGDAHLEIFGSRERLAATKWGLFSHGARAALNALDPESVARAGSLQHAPRWFGALAREAPLPAMRGTTSVLLGRKTLVDGRDPRHAVYVPVEISVPGAHNLANAAAAIAGARELGVPVDAIAQLLPSLRLPPGRFESLPMAGGWRIIYDAYNANAAGTIAALDALMQERPQRAIAVLGSMAELGEESEGLHERVGAHAATRASVLLLTGDYAGALERGARRAGLGAEAIVRIAGNREAAGWLRANARRGDAVLLKGSRKYKMEQIVEELSS